MAQEQWTVAMERNRTIDLARIRSLRVSLIAGSVDIVGHDEDTTRIEVNEVHKRDLTVTLNGDAVEISQTPLGWDDPLGSLRSLRPQSAHAAISVLVPRDIALSLGVVSATTLVTGLHHTVRLNSMSGDLQTVGLTGALDINTASGEIGITDHSGSITVNAASGEITASGAIRRFTANTVSGDIFLDVLGTPEAITSRSISANLTARFDPELDLHVTVNTVSGKLQFGGADITGARARGFDGTLEGVGADRRSVRVVANSVAGCVSLLRRAEVPAGTSA